MKKAPEAFRTIGEVAELLETPAHVLRFWESKFYQIKPVKRAGGRRYYRPDDVALIAGIRHLLQDKGMTIRGVQKMLQEDGVRHVAGLAPPVAADQDAPESLAQTDTQGEGAAIDAVHGRPDAAAERQRFDMVTPFPAPPRRDASPPAYVPVAPPPFTDPASGHDTSVAENAGDAARGAARQGPARPADSGAGAAASAARDGSEAGAAPPVMRAAPDTASADAAKPDDADEATAGSMPTGRPAQALRRMARGTLGARADRLAILAGRIDRLLDRMSEASGAGRW